jgi:hypothetical protein
MKGLMIATVMRPFASVKFTDTKFTALKFVLLALQSARLTYFPFRLNR